MPGVYRAERHAVLGGRAGLALPFTPTQGPIVFSRDHTGYLDSPMLMPGGVPWVGQASTLPGGIKSSGVDDCAIVCVAELAGTIGAGSSWGRVFFAHLAGGGWIFGDPERYFASFTSRVDRTRCYSLVYANRESSARESVQKLLGDGFPANKLSIYISNAHTTHFAMEFQVMGEFGETFSDEPGSVIAGPPYGPVTTDISRWLSQDV